MAKIFTHVPHPHIAHRSAKGPPKVEDQFSTEGPIARFNTFLALKITAGVGTMWCAYAFAALAAVSLPSAIRSHDAVTIVSWISQTFLQLVLLSIIIVGQNVQSAAADACAGHLRGRRRGPPHCARDPAAHGGSGPTDQSDPGGSASPSIVSPIGRAAHPIATPDLRSALARATPERALWRVPATVREITMGNDTVAAMFAAEQEAFVSLVRGLTPEQWKLPSLCPGWTVRDVVVHAAFHTHRGLRETFGSTEKYTALLVERAHADTIDGLISWFASPAPRARGATRSTCASWLSTNKMCVALWGPRGYPEDTMRMCLERCTTVNGTIFILARKHRLGHGLRLVATDIAWSKGNGPEVAGTGEAVLMAIAGRAAALADLTGPGVAILTERYGTIAAPAAT